MKKNNSTKIILFSIICMLSSSLYTFALTENIETNTQSIFSKKNKKHNNEHEDYNKSRNISIAAEILNIPEEILKKQIEEGTSLYDLLKDAKKIQEFKDKVLEELNKHLDDEVKKGRLTKEKAQKIYKHKKSKIDSWDGSEPFGSHENTFLEKENYIKIASGILGISENDLKKELDSGKSLGEILKAAGKLDVFKAKLTEEYKKQLDKEIKEGRLTTEKATEKLSKFKNKMNKWNGEKVD